MLTIGEVQEVRRREDGSMLLLVRYFKSFDGIGGVSYSRGEEFFNVSKERSRYFADVRIGDWIKIRSYPYYDRKTRKMFLNVFDRKRNFAKDDESWRGKEEYFGDWK